MRKYGKMSRGQMLGILAGLACVIALPYAATPKAKKFGDRGVSAVVRINGLPEQRATYLGKGSDGSRTWHTEDRGERMVRASRFVGTDGIGTILVTVVEVGKWEVNVRAMWTGYGEYVGERTDYRTGAKSKTKVRVELPPIED